MALQTNVLENGEWVTRNVDPLELFRQSRSTQPKTKQQLPSTPPTYGILTKTVIESPVVRWILPVQLRSSRCNDIAFIGDHFVQIRELRGDTQLQDVIVRHDFGSRIKNAQVIGPSADPPDGMENDGGIKCEDGDVEMADSVFADSQSGGQNGQLPPQLLALVLERGDLIFLYLKEDSAGKLEFVFARYDIPESPVPYPGFHMVVNPSSRYMALACTANLFYLYELESMETLRERHAKGQKLRPVKAIKPRAVSGIIHQIQFLYPNPADDYHVILMLILVHNETSRLSTYDWEQDENLEEIFQNEKSGYRLDNQWQMPILVIPLTVHHSFILVTESCCAMCLDIMTGSPRFESFDPEEHEDTIHHLGNNRPLWTAWTRPPRLPRYVETKDVIYLAREDGVIQFIEIDEDASLETMVAVGTMECNINTALACSWDQFADVLITSGDSGPGALARVKARGRLEKIGPIPNWSPSVDFVVANISPKSTEENKKATMAKRRADSQVEFPLRPDRIFACSGRGSSGSIAEYRYGLAARIGLQWSWEAPVRRCWALPALDETLDGGLRLLLALPNRTDVVDVSDDWSGLDNLAQDQVSYDLSSSTLAAGVSQSAILQVTTSSVTIITPTESTRHLCHDIDADLSEVITDAAISDNTVALSLHGSSGYQVKSIVVEGLNFTSGPSFQVEGEVTCLALGHINSRLVMMAGIWQTNTASLAIYPTGSLQEGSEVQPIILDLCRGRLTEDPSVQTNGRSTYMEALTSIIVVEENGSTISLAIGTRSGEIFTVAIDSAAPPPGFQHCCEKFALESTHIFPLNEGTEPPAVFACSDAGLSVLTDYSTHGGPHFEKKIRVWPINVEEQGMPTPVINSVLRIRSNLSGGYGNVVLMIAGSTIYISELQSEPKPVLRHLHLGRTPSKVMYSCRLEALVVAVCKNGRPSVVFLDPENGDDLSFPTDSRGDKIDYISGLGEKGTTIRDMTEWKYHKGGRTWEFIVIAMRAQNAQSHPGRLLIISADKREDDVRRIRFFTKWKNSYPAPVWSIAPEEQGLFACVGKVIYYDMLNNEEKKLEEAKKYELSSPAGWMKVVDGHLHTATAHHSLEIIDYKSDPNDETMTRLYTDDHAKDSVHFTEAATEPHQPITLLSDMCCGLWGMWVPARENRPLQTVFQADLHASVRRFAKGRTRPQWASMSRKTQYGCVPNSADGSDIIGLSIDGSLRHFTLLDVDAWRLLRYIQNLALMTDSICPFEPWQNVADPQSNPAWDPEDPEPQLKPLMNMQVDGDVLQRCLDKRALEQLTSEPECANRFRQLLDALGSGKYTESFQDSDNASLYLDLAYDILRYYLAPVL